MEQLQSETLTLRQVIITMSGDHSAPVTNKLGEYQVNVYREYTVNAELFNLLEMKKKCEKCAK